MLASLVSSFRSPQREMKLGAAAGLRAGPDPAAVNLDDGAADRQPDAQPVGLGAEEGVEEMHLLLGRQTAARLRAGDLGGVAVARDRAYPHLAPRRAAHGIDGLTQQLEDDLLDPDLVDQHGRSEERSVGEERVKPVKS